MSCYCDYDPASFYVRDIRRARKRHVCEECNGIISPGEKYEHVTGKWDDVATFKTCSRCVDLRTWVKNNVPCFCWAHGRMLDDAHEAVLEAHYRAGEEVAGIRFGFLRRREATRRFNAAARAAIPA